MKIITLNYGNKLEVELNWQQERKNYFTQIVKGQNREKNRHFDYFYQNSKLMITVVCEQRIYLRLQQCNYFNYSENFRVIYTLEFDVIKERVDVRRMHLAICNWQDSGRRDGFRFSKKIKERAKPRR